MKASAPTREEVRFLLGELPQCEGGDGLGCGTADRPRPATVLVDGERRHLCDECAAEREGDRTDNPIARIVRQWTREMELQ